jgi:integrase
LDFVHQGKRHVITLGKNIARSAAKEIASVRRAAILKGEVGIGRRPKDLPFAKAKDDFLAWASAKKRPNTARSYRECLARLSESFGGKRLSEITPWLVEKHHHGRVKSGAPIAANRELTVLKALFNRMAQWKKYEGPNPAVDVEPFRESKGRLRYLEPAEEQALLAVAAEPLRTLILTGVDAGLRLRAEALTLHREDVDLNRTVLTVQAAYAKNGKSRTVNLNERLKLALAELMARGTSDLIFTNRSGKPLKSIRNVFRTACFKAGLGEDVTPHTLRHTFASRLVMAGVDLRTVQELGGWSDIKMLERYAHLSPSHKQDAVEKLALFHTQIPPVPSEAVG